MAKVIKGTDEIPTKFEEEKKTIRDWCLKLQIGLLNEALYQDETLYTAAEFEEQVPREIQIPLSPSNGLVSVANDLVPKEFAKKFKQLKKMQDELSKVESEVKKKLQDMFESIPELETNTVTVDGIKFTYVSPSVRNTFDSKKFQEDHPEEYKKYLKQSNVSGSIRISIEW